MICNKCGTDLGEYKDKFCIKCGNDLTKCEKEVKVDAVKPLGLKWHKFLIYLYLFIGVFTNLVMGFGSMTGIIYIPLQETLSKISTSLQAINILFGFSLLIIGIYGVFTRFQLARLKKGSVAYLLSYYAINGAMEIIYIVSLFIILEMNVDMNILILVAVLIVAFIRSLITLITIVVNWIYYNKRKHLFV